ncbi:ABC transporter substrate-binding protein [Nonomuraea turcica]|uniref:ABC transporter substrate-binding protein n=1 Tax=Nonomuraea sp. G32 TaxID=3067274 RepID=UPI00273B9FB7|nr:ABC transporter substrate-binding protein [Nonomuraea sp. G32]MDP4502546.1 ABC transporter substrate-binding protein [Nonomuraea sp. G32]
MPVSPPRRPLVAPLRGTAVALVLLSLGACSADPESTSGGANETTSAELVSSLPAAKGEVEQITWNLSGEPDTLFPSNAATYGGGQVVGNLCDALLKTDAEFGLTPQLATYEQVDPRTLVYKIRDGVKFWNGDPLTAEDVAYSMNRAKDPSSIVSFIYQNVESIKAAGDKVTVKFSTPDALFNNEMASIAGMVIQKAHAERAGKNLGTPGGGVMCSGPFKLESWRSGDSIALSRNDSYWNPERRALAKSVKFTFVSDSTALTQALNAGEIDGAYEISPSAVPALRSSKAGRLVFGPSMQSTGMAVARPDGPLDNIKLRQALQTIIDREALAKVVFNGAATPTYTSLSTTTWPNDQKQIYQAAYQPFVKERSFDIAKAKALVTQSGYQGQELVLAIKGGDDSGSRTAQLVQQQAKQAGINIKINPLTPLAFDQAAYDATKREGIDLLLSSSFNVAQDPLEPMGFNLLPGQPYNYTDYDNAEVTKLLTEARQTFDPVKRAKLIIAVQEISEPDSALIPLIENSTITFLNHRLTGAITSFAYWSMPQMAFIGTAG